MGISASSIDEENLSPLYQWSAEASEPQLSPSSPLCQSKSDEKHTLIKTNIFKSVHRKIQDWLKRVITYMME